MPDLLLLAESRKSLFAYLQQGGAIGLVIVLLSLVGLGLAIAQILAVRRARLAPDDVEATLRDHLRKRDVNGAVALCREPDYQCFLTRVFGAGLIRCSRSPFGFLELKTALEESGHAEVARLYRATDAIGLIATIAPMLGLLGTVVGMVGAFDTISMTEGPARPDQLAGNIQAALVTTVLGLVVAIPATAVHTYLRNRIDSVTGVIGDTVEELAALLDTRQPAAGPQQAAPAPSPTPAPSSPGAGASSPAPVGAGGVRR